MYKRGVHGCKQNINGAGRAAYHLTMCRLLPVFSHEKSVGERVEVQAAFTFCLYSGITHLYPLYTRAAILPSYKVPGIRMVYYKVSIFQCGTYFVYPGMSGQSNLPATRHRKHGPYRGVLAYAAFRTSITPGPTIKRVPALRYRRAAGRCGGQCGGRAEVAQRRSGIRPGIGTGDSTPDQYPDDRY